MRIFPMLFVIFIIQACASIGVTTIKAASPKPDECALDIYTEAAEIQKPYEVVCLLDAMSAGHIFAETTVAGAIHASRRYACQCGASGVLIDSTRRENSGFWGRGFAILKAIRYKN